MSEARKSKLKILMKIMKPKGTHLIPCQKMYFIGHYIGGGWNCFCNQLRTYDKLKKETLR